jgi:hypothetical protein
VRTCAAAGSWKGEGVVLGSVGEIMFRLLGLRGIWLFSELLGTGVLGVLGDLSSVVLEGSFN